jgi:hypothetical protein
MPTLTIEYRSDAERLALEQAIAYSTPLQQLALSAPDGTVLTTCEQLALHEGRALLRSTRAAALQSRIAAGELKGGPRASAPRRTPHAPRGGTPAPS